jgi:type I restriction enzyme R subunit
MISLEDYRAEMIQRVLKEAHTLADFRELWVEQENRLALIRHLRGEHYAPEIVQSSLQECDLFDVFAHYGYRCAALKRWEREVAYLSSHKAWFAGVDNKAAVVLKGIGHQFGKGGTEALESELLWEVPEIRRVGGVDALKALGRPVDVVREAKMRLFGV